MSIKFYIFYFLTSVCIVYGKDCPAEIDVVEENCEILGPSYNKTGAQYDIKNGSSSDVILLVFYVKATRNAIIQFDNEAKKTFKVVLGAVTEAGITPWKNTSYSLISSDPTLLSNEEWRGFWIEIFTQSEWFRVGRKGSELPILDNNNKATSKMSGIKKFSFFTTKNDTIKWGVGCASDNGNKSYNHPKEKLNCDLFQTYNKSISPFVINGKNQTDQINVSLEFTGQYVIMDTGNEILELNGTMNITWKDERLIWNQHGEKHPNTLRINNDSIWKPNIILESQGPKFPHHTNFNSDHINITDQGIVTWTPFLQIQINTTARKNLSDKLVTCRMQFSTKFSATRFDTLIIENPATYSNHSSPTEVNKSSEYPQQFGEIARKYVSEFQPSIPREETLLGDKFVEILKCRQFSTYNRFQVPKYASQYQTVIEINGSSADLDYKDGIFHFNGTAKIFWFDERLTWDPKEFTHQYIPSIEYNSTWKPDIAISSSHNTNSPFDTGTTIISNEGILMWTPSINITTKCDVNLKNWPWDSHKCQKITIKINTPGAEFAKPQIEFPATSEWLISGSYSPDLITTRNTTSLELTLHRKITQFQKLLFFQFIVTSSTMLCSFGISPLRWGKKTLNIVSLSLLTSFYITLVLFIPTNTWYASNLLYDYTVLFVIGVLSNFLSIYLSLLVRKSRNSRLPKYILSIIDNRFVRLTLFLTLQKESNYPAYRNDLHMENLRAGAIREEENDRDLQTSGENESNNSHNEAFRRDWLKVAVACDHLALLVSGAFFIMIFLNNFQPILEVFGFL